MMGHVPQWVPQYRRPIDPWVRRRTRRWVRGSSGGPAGLLFAAIPSLPRAELARLTERMIDRMDEIDGDPEGEANGDELDCTGSHEEDTPYFGFGTGDGYPGDPDDAEDSHDSEMEDSYD